MTDNQEYNVNFFKPLSNHAKANTKLILILATVWFVAVFGFQVLLMVLNEPTPEKSFTVFQSVYPEVTDNPEVSIDKKQDFAKSVLFVLGKNIAVTDNHKEVLKKALSWAVVNIAPDSTRKEIMEVSGEEYVKLAIENIGLTNEGFDKIMVDLLPLSLVKVESDMLDSETKAALPGIMELYLVHNQNVLTDFNFLGFPFHYWYTAQFLLILFVVLCLVYAVLIERSNKKHDFVEED